MKNIIPFKKDVIFKTNLSEITSISLENTLSIDNDTLKGDFIVSGEYKVSDRSTTVEPFNINLPFEIAIDERYDTKMATIDIDDFYYEIVNNNVLSVSIDVLVDKLKEKPLMELEDLKDENIERTILEVEEEKSETDKTLENDILNIDEILNSNDIELEEEEVREMKDEKISEKESKIVEEPVVEQAVEESIPVSKEELISEDRTDMVEEKINSIFNQFSKDSEVYVTYNVFILRDGDTIDSILEKYNITEEELKKYNDLSNLQLGDKIIIPNVYERN